MTRGALCALAAILLLAFPIDAVPIPYNFTATVISIVDPGGVLTGSGLLAGGSYTTAYTVDSNAIDSDPGPIFGLYDPGVLTASVQLGSMAMVLDPGSALTNQMYIVSAAVAGLVAAYLGPERSLVTSFNIHAVDSVHLVDPSIPIGYVTELWDPRQAVDRAVAHEMQHLHPYDAMVDAALVRRAHEAGLQVHVWVVDEPERMSELIEMGVDGLITNVPDVARKVVDDRV